MCFPPTDVGFGQWKTEHVWHLWILGWALRRSCVFLLVLCTPEAVQEKTMPRVAACPKRGRDTWSWPEPQATLIYLLDYSRNLTDLGTRERNGCCCKTVCFREVTCVALLKQELINILFFYGAKRVIWGKAQGKGEWEGFPGFPGRGGCYYLSITGLEGPCSKNFSELSRPITVPDRPLC